jgi:hypothetical protein
VVALRRDTGEVFGHVPAQTCRESCWPSLRHMAWMRRKSLHTNALQAPSSASSRIGADCSADPHGSRAEVTAHNTLATLHRRLPLTIGFGRNRYASIMRLRYSS